METEGNGLGGQISGGERQGKVHPYARSRRPLAQVRGVLAERVVVSTPLDPFLSLKALASYSGLSVRKLREHLDDPAHPLPCYRVGGKILVRRSEFDTWVSRYRQSRDRVARVVDDVIRSLGEGRN